jgi:uncharacterized damage-inducible protein DinB
MNDPQTLQFLWQYMVYADAQMLAASDTLSDDAYHREQGISFGSVHKLLVHGMSAQNTWLQRLNGLESPAAIDAATVSRATLAGRWTEVHQEVLAFAAAQTPASLTTMIHARSRTGVKFELPVGLCMLHVSDHATYHRGQINSTIKLAGGIPSPVMLFTYGVRSGIGREE